MCLSRLCEYFHQAEQDRNTSNLDPFGTFHYEAESIPSVSPLTSRLRHDGGENEAWPASDPIKTTFDRLFDWLQHNEDMLVATLHAQARSLPNSYSTDE